MQFLYPFDKFLENNHVSSSAEYQSENKFENDTCRGRKLC